MVRLHSYPRQVQGRNRRTARRGGRQNVSCGKFGAGQCAKSQRLACGYCRGAAPKGNNQPTPQC
nr:MAG TPA: hypothetical protein [Caudoviricetes sp.]